MSFAEEDEPAFMTIEITLPTYLAKFLKEISKEFAMDPGQLIVQILQPYFEVYKKGLYKCKQ